MNLNGLRILNTRPLGQNLQLQEDILSSGGVSIALPALSIEPTPDTWLNQLPNFVEIDIAIFISANAVSYFFESLRNHGLAWPSSIQNIAIGKATGNMLSKYNVRLDEVPKIADSEHLLALESLQQVSNKKILLVKGVNGKQEIEHTLFKKQAILFSVDVYRRVLPCIEQELIDSLWHDDLVDIILFTSLQAMHHLFVLFGEVKTSWLCSKPCVVISERLAHEAYALGINTVLVSQYDKLIDTLLQYAQHLKRIQT